MATTTNFGWSTPDDTALVKDGASAIRTLGSSIDTSMAELKGGTTGQVLSKTSNTDMDFTWTNGGDITEVTAGIGISGGGTTGAVTITNSMATAIDAKGDVIAGTGADTFSRLAVGANNTVLTADSAAATGLKWAAPTTGWTLLSTTTPSGATTSLTGLSSGTYNQYVILTAGLKFSANATVRIQLNSSTPLYFGSATTTTVTSASTEGFSLGTVLYDSALNPANNNGIMIISNANDVLPSSAPYKPFISYGMYRNSSGTNVSFMNAGAFEIGNISSITFALSTGTYSAGTILLYGVK